MFCFLPGLVIIDISITAITVADSWHNYAICHTFLLLAIAFLVNFHLIFDFFFYDKESLVQYNYGQFEILQRVSFNLSQRVLLLLFLCLLT